jgi:hypothetical protein
MSKIGLRRMIRETIMLELLDFDSKTNNQSEIPDWDSNVSVSKRIASYLPDSEVQSTGKKSGLLVVRIRMKEIVPIQRLVKAVSRALNYNENLINVTDFSKNSSFSSKYLSSIIDVNDIDGNILHNFAVVAVTGNKGKQVGGIAGPGENELVDAVNAAGASIENPINIDFGGKVLRGVTGAIKPVRGDAKGGEPKIDVLILGKDGKAHEDGGLSLKLKSGTPSYDGWNRIIKFMPEAENDLDELISQYIEKTNAKRISGNRYEYSGNFAIPVDDEIAFFAIYGNENTSGGLAYNKKSADYVVTVSNKLSFEMIDDTLIASGYEFHEKHSIFRGTDWEPFWLIRGSSDRSSGKNVVILGSRIVVAPRQRVKSVL